VRTWSDIASIRFDPASPYYRKIDELTTPALERCPGQFLVGYTDLHGGLDCVADWRDPQQLCLDTVDAPERVHELVRLAEAHFLEVFDHYDTILKTHRQPSITWMGIPSLGRLHIPSCDFAALASHRVIDEFYLPTLHKEVRAMTHNIFHLDGKGRSATSTASSRCRGSRRSSGSRAWARICPSCNGCPCSSGSRPRGNRWWSTSRSMSSRGSSAGWSPRGNAVKDFFRLKIRCLRDLCC
jgi:hypothetical protein